MEILSDGQLRRRFSENAVSLSKKFDLDISVKNFEDLYIRIIKA